MAELALRRCPILGVATSGTSSVFLSNFAMALWYIKRRPRVVVAVEFEIERPSDHPG